MPPIIIINRYFFIAVSLIIIGYVYPILPISVATKRYLGFPEDSLLNFTELTAKYGYRTDEHSVVTEDGYILQLFRIVKAKNCHGIKKKTPVIMMHGLLQNSDSWIIAGPQAGLAYLISDACHDLWVTNARGNHYSRRHITLNPDINPEFWQFSAHEIAVYDVPAIIDYILDHTRAEKVNYIGFSQGGQTYFIMCSERPKYCEKARLLITLAPASRLKHTKSIIFRMVTTLSRQFEKFLSTIGTLELLSKGALTHEFFLFFCQFFDFNGMICGSIKDLLDGSHAGSMNASRLPEFASTIIAGTSVHNLAWLGQMVTSDRFEKFDYGKSKNIEIYGSEKPPEYNLNAVTVPVLNLYGRNDQIVDIEDIKWLEEKLPNLVESIEVSDSLWTHFDFCFSQYIGAVIFSTINDYLNKLK